LRNSAPTLNEPVPDKHWTVVTLLSVIAGLSAPKMSLALNLLKSEIPTMGMYSLTRDLREVEKRI